MESTLLKKLSRKLVASNNDYMVNFRNNLRVYVDEKDISLDDIADAAGISIETLKTLLYGKSADCKLSTAIALAKALEVSIDELVGANTLDPIICESIQITRNLPDNFVVFIRWAIRYHEKQLLTKQITSKALNVMTLDCSNNGNLTLSNNFDLVDFKDLPDFIRYKAFMAIRIPSDQFMPVYSEGDILILANDRNPLQNETVVVVTDGYVRIVKRKEEKEQDGRKIARYYSIRNGAYLADEESIEEIMGYVIKTVNNLR